MPVEANLTDGSRWEFDAEVADAFDDMLARSIPQYEEMRAIVTDIAVRHLIPGSRLLDLGASRGEAMARVDTRLGDEHRRAGTQLVGIEVSPPMLAAARSRFHGHPNARLLGDDLRRGLPVHNERGRYTVALAVLTLQFIPIEYRPTLVSQVYDVLRPGGAFIVVEKLLAANGRVHQLLIDLYWERKRANGYSDEEVARKAAALEGVLVPLTAAGNEELLHGAGFSAVEPVWRWANFGAWLAVK